MTQIEVEGKEKYFGYNDSRNGWYGKVINSNPYIGIGTEVRVVHQSDLPVRTTAAGPMGLEHGGGTLTVNELTSGSEEIRIFTKK